MSPTRTPPGVRRRETSPFEAGWEGCADYWTLLDHTASDGLGVFDQRVYGVIDAHAHDDRDMIYLVDEGTGTVVLGDVEHHVRPGDVVWIPRGTVHEVRPDPDGLTYRAVVQVGP